MVKQTRKLLNPDIYNSQVTKPVWLCLLVLSHFITQPSVFVWTNLLSQLGLYRAPGLLQEITRQCCQKHGLICGMWPWMLWSWLLQRWVGVLKDRRHIEPESCSQQKLFMHNYKENAVLCSAAPVNGHWTDKRLQRSTANTSEAVHGLTWHGIMTFVLSCLIKPSRESSQVNNVYLSYAMDMIQNN